MRFFIITLLLISLSISTQAQFRSIRKAATKHAKKYAKKKAVEEGTKLVNKQVDKGIDKGIEVASREIDKLVEWEDEQFADEKKFLDTTLIASSDISWTHLNFATGKDLIFYDKPFSFDKKHKEPYYWIVDKKAKGKVQISDVTQGYALTCSYKNSITPKVKDPKSDYLPHNFTFEFEYIIPVSSVSKPFKIYWYAKGLQENKEYEPIIINRTKVSYKDTIRSYPYVLDNTDNFEDWYRVSISYINDTTRIYMNERLMIVMPEKESFNPTGITLDFVAYTPLMLKSFILAGNPTSVEEQLKEGKYISYKIDYLRDINRLTGVSLADLIRVAKFLVQNPDTKLNVDVYFSHEQRKTLIKDNDSYCKQKTDLIKESLVSMGVNENQLIMSSKGYIIPSDYNPKNNLSEAVIFTVL